MYQVCGSFTGGAYTQTARSEGLYGSLLLYVPFTISQGADFMGTDSITGSYELTNAMTENGTLIIPSVFSEVLSDSIELSSSLSDMNGVSVSTDIFAPLSMGGDLWADNLISVSMTGNILLSNTVGSFGLWGVFDIYTPLDTTGFCGATVLSLPQSTAYLHTDTLAVYADGRDVSKYLTTAEITLFGDSGIPSVTAEFSASLTPASLMFVINGEIFSFKVFSRKSSNGKTVLGGETGKNESTISINEKAQRASQIAVGYSDKIVWAGADYVVTDIHGDYTAFELAALMAEPFQMVRLLPTGYITVSGSGSDFVIEPDTLFSYETTEKTSEYSSVTVTYGSTSAYVEADTTAQAGGYGTVKVFGYYGGNISTDADGIILKSKGVRETFTEDVFFSDSVGTLKRVPLAIETPNAVFRGTEVILAGAYGYQKITYTAVYDEYLITSGTVGKKSAEIYTDNSVTVVTGRKGTDLSISLPHVNDRATALKAAKERAKDTKSTTVTLPRTEALTLPAGLSFKQGKIAGRITSAIISITAEPLVIKDIIEVKS